MPKVILIDKHGKCKLTKLKPAVADSTEIDVDELFRKTGGTGSAVDSHFSQQCSWVSANAEYTLFARTAGRANSENKFEFPPPIASKLFFGTCVVVKRESGAFIDFASVAEWESTVARLQGGFEDLHSNDDDEDSGVDEDEEETTTTAKTSHGYIKDGFVVEDNDNDNDEEISPKKKKPKLAKLTKVPKLSKKKSAFAAGGETTTTTTTEEKKPRKRNANAATAASNHDRNKSLMQSYISGEAEELTEEEYFAVPP